MTVMTGRGLFVGGAVVAAATGVVTLALVADAALDDSGRSSLLPAVAVLAAGLVLAFGLAVVGATRMGGDQAGPRRARAVALAVLVVGPGVLLPWVGAALFARL